MATKAALGLSSDGMTWSNTNGVQGTFETFAGTDMTVFFGNREVGSLMSMTVSIVREVVPIYTTASSNPRAFAKGKRAISGSLVFGQFDRHAMLEGIFSDLDDPAASTEFAQGGSNAIADTLVVEAITSNDRAKSWERNYSDQLPPFDVVVTMINEDGAASAFAVRGVCIVNEGFGFTVDDITQEMACSYVAKSVIRLKPVLAPRSTELDTLLSPVNESTYSNI